MILYYPGLWGSSITHIALRDGPISSAPPFETKEDIELALRCTVVRQPWQSLNCLQSHFPFPWKIVHSCIQIVPWRSFVKSRKFNSSHSFRPTSFVFLSSNQQCICWHKSVSIPAESLFLLRWLVKSMSHNHSLFIKWLFGHILSVLFRTSFLFFFYRYA